MPARLKLCLVASTSSLTVEDPFGGGTCEGVVEKEKGTKVLCLLVDGVGFGEGFFAIGLTKGLVGLLLL